MEMSWKKDDKDYEDPAQQWLKRQEAVAWHVKYMA